MNDQGKSVHISEGVRLYKQQKSPFWWLSASGKRRSTEVRIDAEPDGGGKARDKAIEMAALIKFEITHGIESDKSPTFIAVADQTVEHLESLTPQKQVYDGYISIIERYLKPYFKRKSIVRVDRHELFKFFEWRKRQTKGEISLTQKRMTNKAIWHIFNLACNYGYVAQHLIPELPRVEAKVVKQRDFFTENELTQVLDRFPDFIASAGNYKTREIRQLLEYYVSFLLGTGARPGEEAVTLTFGHISWQNRNRKPVWTARITKGKNSKRKGERGIVLGDRAVEALERVIALHDKYSGLTLTKVIAKYSNDLIFAAQYRGSAPEYGRAFAQYIGYLDMDNRDHTLYSLRHTYITQRLLSDDLPRRAIAKQCGTSEEMIDKFYDHVISLDYADELRRPDKHRSLGVSRLDALFVD